PAEPAAPTRGAAGSAGASPSQASNGPDRRGNAMKLLERVKSFLRHPRGAPQLPYARHRRETAARCLRGPGLEVRALHAPLETPPGCRVTYVDRLPGAELREQYPELGGQELVPVDVVDDGERLEKFAAGSQDFVIANHFLEHAQDPIGTLKAHLRVLA